IIQNRVVVEVKSVEAIAPVHKKQLLSYLRRTDKRLGLLINFNVDLIKDGITRVVNGLQEGSHAKALRRNRKENQGFMIQSLAKRPMTNAKKEAVNNSSLGDMPAEDFRRY